MIWRTVVAAHFPFERASARQVSFSYKNIVLYFSLALPVVSEPRTIRVSSNQDFAILGKIICTGNSRWPPMVDGRRTCPSLDGVFVVSSAVPSRPAQDSKAGFGDSLARAGP